LRVRALVLFHVRVGARLSLLAAAPLSAAPVVGILLQQDPGAALRGAARWLLGAPADPGAGLALALVCLTLASWATGRIAVGQAGWLRHLPVSETAQRRAALLAAMTAQSSVVVAALVLLPFATGPAGASGHASALGIAPGRLFAIPLTCAAAALASWPAVGSRRSRFLAIVALLLLAPASAAGIAGAVPLLVLSELLCGALASRDEGPRRRSSRLPGPLLVALRALGPGALPALVPALVPIAAMAALRINNDLAPPVARGAARFGGALSGVFLLAALAERLAVRRPVWAWARSLPWSAPARLRGDAALLAASCSVPLALTAALDGVGALQLAGCLPVLAVHAAAAMHPRDARQRSVAGEVLMVGAFAAAGVALLPWLWLPALAAVPLVWRHAARRERAQPVSLWLERHHRSSGDPLSWSAR
jgi:hypothetical protein